MSQITYIQSGDYQIPNLTFQKQPEIQLGRYALMHQNYLKENRRIRYLNLLTSGKLITYLKQIEEEALKQLETITKKMQEQGLMKAILKKIKAGTPYVGWSAGSNVCCPTICTTNDMPILQPESFRAIGAIPFQINPHYLDANPEGHAGETREQRILEYIEANPKRWVVGLREGCILHYENEQLELIGKRPMRIFRKGVETHEVQAGDDLSFLFNK